MSLGFVLAACAFALVLGCAVACVDRWREARLAAATRLRPAQPFEGVARPAAPPATHRRARFDRTDRSGTLGLLADRHPAGRRHLRLQGGGFAVHIRCFAPAFGVPEDPVTGSANAALPAYLAHHDLLDRTGREYIATQATEMGRDGRVHVRVLDDSGRAEIGGQAVTVVEGEIRV